MWTNNKMKVVISDINKNFPLVYLIDFIGNSIRMTSSIHSLVSCIMKYNMVIILWKMLRSSLKYKIMQSIGHAYFCTWQVAAMWVYVFHSFVLLIEFVLTVLCLVRGSLQVEGQLAQYCHANHLWHWTPEATSYMVSGGWESF